MGFALASHYCGGSIVESKFIIGYEKLDCGMPNMDQESHEHVDNSTHFSKGICCENDYRYLDTEDNLKSDISQLIPDHQFTNEDHLIINPDLKDFSKLVNYVNYDPPLVERNILTLHQVFRI